MFELLLIVQPFCNVRWWAIKKLSWNTSPLFEWRRNKLLVYAGDSAIWCSKNAQI